MAVSKASIYASIADAEQKIADSDSRTMLTDLFDNGFVELDKYVTDKDGAAGVVTGYGFCEDTAYYAFAQDISVRSGAFSKASAAKINKVFQLAAKNGSPIVGFYNSKGGDVAEGVELLGAYSDIAAAAAAVSGVVPQIAVITGVCAGTSAVIACMADIVIMTEKAELFVTPPFNSVDKSAGAGSAAFAAKSGAAAIVVKDEKEALELLKKLLFTLPINNLTPGGLALESAEVDSSSDCIFAKTALKGSVIELYKDFGNASYTAIGTVGYNACGFVSTAKAARLSKDDCAKIARFVSFCDAFSIPVITEVNSEGFELSSVAEAAGAVRDAAKLTQVYAAATTPKIAVITGNALGGIFTAFAGNNADCTIAYENAVIAPTTPKAAAIFLHADELDGKDAKAKLAEITDDYAKSEASPFNAAAFGFVDRIVDADDISEELVSALSMVSSKKVSAPARKHINFVY